ncbi:MAG TPA: hypothetical protein VGS58_20735 [Candidatus Sulfopaludibacter sp.]|nr:hypothetical protein [Candidatus Sulfopaludibacter sp.]
MMEGVVNGIFLAPRWEEGMKALGRSPNLGLLSNIAFKVCGLPSGLLAVWLYVTFRPQFAARPRTAVIAGIATWFACSFPASVPPMAMHLFSRRLLALASAAARVEIVPGTLLGGWLYQEKQKESAALSMAAAA